MDIRKKREKEESEDREGGREGSEKIGGGNVNKKRRKI